MINLAVTLAVGVAMFIGGLFTQDPSSLDRDWTNPPLNFGAISFPTSLDTFENPSATQSVATVVTHSTHHGNANDALEALEAKVGTGASTAVTNSVFAGTSAGVSSWSTGPTVTNLSLTGSTTLQNFTFVNATGTSATTTNFFSTTASTTNFFGGGLTSCNSGNVLTYDGAGRFGCTTDSTGAGSSADIAIATSTSVGYLATNSLSMDANDMLMVWAKSDDADCTTPVTQRLRTKVSTYVASTTLNYAETDTTGPCTITLMGLYQASTTVTVIVDLVRGAGSSSTTTIMAEVKRY